MKFFFKVIIKYLNILKEQFFIALKEIKEYKSNSYSVLFIDVFVLLIYIAFFSVYQSVAGDFLDWNTYDFILYYLIMLIEWKIVWLFGLINLRPKLIRGDFNIVLNKPINPFIYFSLKTMNGATVFTIPPLILSITLMMYWGDYNNFFISSLLIFLGSFYFMFMYNLFESMAFIMKENGFLINVMQRTNSTVKRFTPLAFDGLKVNVFYLMPGAVSGYFSLSVLKGNFIFLEYLVYILFSISIIIIFTIFLWHYGLKRYEAFG